MEVEGDAEAKAGVARHGGDGEVGGPVAGVHRHAPGDGEFDSINAEEGEGAETGGDGLAVVDDVAVGDHVQGQTHVEPTRTGLNQKLNHTINYI